MRRTGRAIRRSTGGSPTRSSRKWTARRAPWCSSRTITSPCCRSCSSGAARPRVAIFWHIPWPNPEAFRICPWQNEILDGMLGADLIGFHTQAHCNNFLETVDRAFESQIDWEHFTARRHDHVTHVRPFPISVVSRAVGRARSASAGRAAGRSPARRSAVGASSSASASTAWTTPRASSSASAASNDSSRNGPDYAGRFTFVQIGAPSRTRIKRYHDLIDEVTAEAERINGQVRHANWKPIVLLDAHHSHRRDRALLPRRRCLPGHLAARRHEPRRQGVRRRPRRRGRRA